MSPRKEKSDQFGDSDIGRNLTDQENIELREEQLRVEKVRVEAVGDSPTASYYPCLTSSSLKLAGGQPSIRPRD
ncbi:MAG TPA: hypothetical protein VKA25_11935 [Gemmatimonadales bacterium]|nr:hypothetical protein [Gemmatimonadales bacterium]